MLQCSTASLKTEVQSLEQPGPPMCTMADAALERVEREYPDGAALDPGECPESGLQ